MCAAEPVVVTSGPIARRSDRTEASRCNSCRILNAEILNSWSKISDFYPCNMFIYYFIGLVRIGSSLLSFSKEYMDCSTRVDRAHLFCVNGINRRFSVLFF